MCKTQIEHRDKNIDVEIIITWDHVMDVINQAINMQLIECNIHGSLQFTIAAIIGVFDL